MRVVAALVLAIVALTPAAASAQVSAPGPYVFDLRGAMSGAPGDVAFYPPVPTTLRVPQRAFGFGVGGHVYAFHIGAARLGFGVDLMRVRGTAKTDTSAIATTSTTESASTNATGAVATGTVTASMAVTTVAPQVSFNFGAHEGWSYLSAGYGTTTTRAEVNIPTIIAGVDSGGSRRLHAPTLNVGGGARWFLRERLAFGFDIRFHHLRATNGAPAKQIVGLSVGMSLR
jgi:opacity protein-like surface antigen